MESLLERELTGAHYARVACLNTGQVGGRWSALSARAVVCRPEGHDAEFAGWAVGWGFTCMLIAQPDRWRVIEVVLNEIYKLETVEEGFVVVEHFWGVVDFLLFVVLINSVLFLLGLQMGMSVLLLVVIVCERRY